jgi:hypothetical protein
MCGDDVDLPEASSSSRRHSSSRRRLPIVVRVAFAIFPFLFAGTTASNDEFRLYSDLLTNYNPLERPVVNSSEKLIVKVKYRTVDIVNKNIFSFFH